MSFEIIFAAAGPAEGHFHGRAAPAPVSRELRALVKRHDDVSTQGNLDFHGAFGCEQVRRAVQMGAKCDSIFGDFAEFAEAEDLEAARIGEHGAIPANKFVESAEFADQIMARAEVEMVGIAKNNLRVQFFQNVLGNGLDGTDGSNRHKCWGVNLPVRRKNLAEAR